ncbi:MAG: TIGR00296 family protein [Candidatus Methanoplasma sp.]|jgi:uncharacterized protein (TIGR00296 family)|nr:TIGR00296 family protein [Candidatus Methanoplasma sp.]
MDDRDGETAVRAARAAAEAETEGRSADISLPPSFSVRGGVFVTISKHPSGDLRGCIGYPEPLFPLSEALLNSAVSACHDSRFPDLTREEASGCTFSVTFLTAPLRIGCSSPEDLMSKIKIGRDGLIIDLHGRKGLLLPQVPVEWNWDVAEYLARLSVKAGLREDAWTDPGAKISAFQGEIFSEASPYGEIKRG